MWVLIVTVFFVVNGDVHQRQFGASEIATQQECMARGREAVDRMSRIDGVTAVAIACSPTPQV